MKIQILSDIHVDHQKNFNYFTNRCVPRAETLVMAGDLCPHNSPEHYDYINSRLMKWKNVILIPGNHEFYGSTIDDPFFGSYEKVYENSKGHKVHYVNNKVLEIDGVTYICTTLWTYIDFHHSFQIMQGMNDFYQIKGMTVDKWNEIHKENKRFLEESLDALPTGKRCIVVTHHVPSFNLISERFRGNSLNEAFSADMDVLIMSYGDKISYWIHGHSHDFLDKNIDGVRFIRNPMGYPGELTHSIKSNNNSKGRVCDMDLVISV